MKTYNCNVRLFRSLRNSVSVLLLICCLVLQAVGKISAVAQELDSQPNRSNKQTKTEATDRLASEGASTPSTDASSVRGRSVVNQPQNTSLNPVTSPEAPDCYKIAPPEIIRLAKTAAQELLAAQGRGEIRNFSEFFPEMLVLTIIDAVVEDEKDRALIHGLNVQRVRQETRRTDKQIGASARAEGTTTAVEKPGYADLLGLAIEHGVVQQSINGTSLTLSTTPYAFVAAANKDTVKTYRDYEFFNRLAFSATFNIDNEDMPLQSARRNQLDEWSGRFRLSGDRSSRSKEFETFWNENVRDAVSKKAVELSLALVASFQQDAGINKQRRLIARKLSLLIDGLVKQTPAPSQADLQREILCQLKQEVYDPVKNKTFIVDEDVRRRMVKETLPALVQADLGEQEAIAAFEQHLKEYNSRAVWTLVYTNKRQVDASDYSVIKLLVEKKFAEPVKFVANLGASFYHHPDRMMNQQNVRDYAAGLSLEGNLAKSPFLSKEEDESQVTFSFSARYQRLLENRHVSMKKADLGVIQVKLEIPFGSGMSFPFSVTYANATELIKEDHVRANFGISFDADKFFMLTRFLKR